MVTTYKDDNGEDYDTWRARRDAEAKQKASTLPKPKPPQQAMPQLEAKHILKGVGTVIGEVEKEMLQRFDELRDEWAVERKSLRRRVEMDISQKIRVERDGLRAETVRLGREVEILKDAIEKLKQELKQ
ncbi:hypothetical protein I6F15_03525 [Bradyrhizobium sp. BRP14]|nr:hypothetical protein [Bradyrhizobium sp. BRP14]